MYNGIDDQRPLALGVITVSVLIALTAAIWPMAGWASWLRPELATMIVMYWIIVAPFRVGMTFAWCLGIAVDILEGAVLCQNALALTLVAYGVSLLRQRISMLSIAEQSAVVFLLVVLQHFVNFWVHSLTAGIYFNIAFLVPALVSAILWPLVKLCLDRLRL